MDGWATFLVLVLVGVGRGAALRTTGLCVTVGVTLGLCFTAARVGDGVASSAACPLVGVGVGVAVTVCVTVTVGAGAGKAVAVPAEQPVSRAAARSAEQAARQGRIIESFGRGEQATR